MSVRLQAPGRTQGLRGEVYGVAVRAVASLVTSPDLEGVDGAGDQGGDGGCVGLAEHTGRAVAGAAVFFSYTYFFLELTHS